MRLSMYLAIKDLKEDKFTDENTRYIVAEEDDSCFDLFPNGYNVKIDFGFGSLIVSKETFVNSLKKLEVREKEQKVEYLINKIKDISGTLPKGEKSKLKAGLRMLLVELD